MLFSAPSAPLIDDLLREPLHARPSALAPRPFPRPFLALSPAFCPLPPLSHPFGTRLCCSQLCGGPIALLPFRLNCQLNLYRSDMVDR